MPINDNSTYTPIVKKYASENASPLWDAMMKMKRNLSPEQIEALNERATKGFKQVNVDEGVIEAKDENEYNSFRRTLNKIPLDPNRNRLIAELGYRPVIRYNKKTSTQEVMPVTKSIPKSSYELGFSTMPDKKITLNSKEEYDQANLINDIDSNLADVYQKRFSPSKLNRNNAYQSYTEANPQDYSKMYLNSADKSAAIKDYAIKKGLNPEELLNTYSQNRNKYYPRDLVAGQGMAEQQGQGAADTNYGYRNYLTTMVPKEIQTQEQVTEQIPQEKIVEQEMRYPFKFGYKSSDREGPSPTKPGGPSGPGGGCTGDLCERQGESMAKRNRFLFRKKYGGKITDDNVSKLLVLLKK